MMAGRNAWRVSLVLIMLAVIWGQSLLPGDVSGAESGKVLALVNSLLKSFRIVLDEHAIRKLGHFAEFGLLGITLALYSPKRLANLAWMAAVGYTAACIDETIQMFVPGRSCQYSDVLLDTAGVLTGLAVTGLIIYIRQKKEHPAKS